MEIIEQTDTVLRIHHIPHVPWKAWFIGGSLGVFGVAALLWAVKFGWLAFLLPLGALSIFIGLILVLPDERHILWTFDRQTGHLTVQRDERSRQSIRDYPLQDIHQALLNTRASMRREGGHVVRSEVMVRLKSGEEVSLPLPHDTIPWMEKRAMVDTINEWLVRDKYKTITIESVTVNDKRPT
jgi:hypothetical protein